jgi:hypothetical protein
MSNDIIKIIKSAAAMGAAEAIRKMQPQNDRISQRQAEKEYGIGFIRRNADRLTVVWNGNRKEYSRAELEQVKVSMSVAAMVVRIENNLIKK